MRSQYLFILFNLFFAVLPAKPPKGFCVHPDGMYYRIIRASQDSFRPIYGDYIYMHLIKQHPNEKEVFNTHIFNALQGVEFPLEKPKHVPDVIQIFLEMAPGDSAVVKIPASEVDSNGSKKKFYTYYLKLISYKSKMAYEIQKKASTYEQRKTDSLLIIDFLRNHSINNAILDSTGIAFQKHITNQEPLLQTGDTVRMNYKGSLVDGSEFDNSYFRMEPLVFIAGKKQVIDGLDIALSYFRKGEAGIIIIPSYLGYAEREVGKIPPNSVLIFDVEILQ